VEIGESWTWQRTFTEDDVRTFAGLSGDAGAHHVEPDESGRLMVHGLLTATLPTKLGGDLNFIAGTMEFRFHRPVFTGDTIGIVGTCEQLGEHRRGHSMTFSFTCANQRGDEVMSGSSSGVVLAPG
jgi:acyl dehydratase